MFAEMFGTTDLSPVVKGVVDYETKTDIMAGSSQPKLSSIRAAVTVICLLVLCSTDLVCSVQCSNSLVESPAFAPVPISLSNSSNHDPRCGLWPVKYQAYEQTAMVSLLRAWNKSDPFVSPHNITNWKESVHPCDQSAKDSGWRGVRCRGMLVNNSDDTNGTSVCEMFIVGLDGDDFGIIGELIPEIGDLHNLEFIYVNHNPGQIGPIPESIWKLPNLKEVQFINNSLSGDVTLTTSMENSALERVDLSHNFLTSFSLMYSSNWPALKYLNASNNLIECPFPPWSDFDQFSNLSEISLDKNIITGELDISTFFKSSISETLTLLSLRDNIITTVVYADDYVKEARTKFLLKGNPFCNNVWFSEADATRCSLYCEHICKYERSNKWRVIVAATSSSSTLVLMLAMLCFGIVLRRNKKYIRALQKKIRKADINAKSFEYNELRVATKNFAPEMKLGAGAYGAVYKGILPNDVVVAVKQLFLETNEGRDDFLNEILLISNLQHRNLVNLKGYCLHGKQTLLVYEYVDNCDLDKLLLRRHNTSNVVLNWQARRNVCQGVAQGLYYLHASSQFRIIHRDIKASNILLDKNLQPKIADFGLARPIEDARSVIMTQQCAGTLCVFS
ncbi:hypothetical protein KC19_11G172900 [Ceratodon purpureus]|uniref:non-specific serine/threonine protein kinase n=1 Tax=Ceratodon purpureus TaxID=3225 RepID=A0A8T0GHE0_CERPU|nr:hypothetical protein KC19_11G172900 [Ceratodon purpureus]